MAWITTEAVKTIRQKLKAEFPKFKFAVTGGNSSKVIVTILSGPTDFSELVCDWNQKQINPHYINDYGDHSPFFAAILKIIKGDSWHDNSDAQVDYFDTAFYIGLNIGKWDQKYEVKK